ncbi:MAG: hypothetical protein L7F78_09885, partial [Syntrophales bacterium LBB04]|nr:hypothetical protein [Syntrophales bacterium LBB04]
ADSKSAAAAEGLPDLRVVALPGSGPSAKPEADVERMARQAIGAIIDALRKPASEKDKPKPVLERRRASRILSFTGRDYQSAAENMEKSFLSQRWSDGLPLVPPTRKVVEPLIAASNLPRDHVVGIVQPKRGVATLESIAINAGMAGARPAYMPLIIAAVQAVTDPAFDLFGVQATGGLAAPLMIVSGPIIKDLNINFSYSTAGPGWRANSTIGRALRLILINIGQAWPGINDMKDVGNPAKFGILIAENEIQTPKGWPTLREQEGFSKDASTVSLYACQSFRQIDKAQWPGMSNLARAIRQMKTALNAEVVQWGEEVVVVFSPTHAEVLANEGYTPESIKRELFEKGRPVRAEFGPRPLGAKGLASGVPAWIDELPDDGLVPAVPTAEHIKILVAGGRGPGAGFFIDRWGFGKSRFVTKEISLPPNWEKLVKGLEGWGTPIEVK